jgi:hypothetical protein
MNKKQLIRILEITVGILAVVLAVIIILHLIKTQ